MAKELHVIAPAENRQGMITNLEIGNSVAITRRVEVEYGLPQGTINRHLTQLREILEQQVRRAKRERKEYEYTIETGSFLSRAGALNLCAVVSRLA